MYEAIIPNSLPSRRITRITLVLAIACSAPGVLACDGTVSDDTVAQGLDEYRVVVISAEDIAALEPGETLDLDMGLDVVYQIDASVSVHDRARLVLRNGEQQEPITDLYPTSRALDAGVEEAGTIFVTSNPHAFATLTDDEVEQLEVEQTLTKESDFRTEQKQKYTCFNIGFYKKYTCTAE